MSQVRIMENHLFDTGPTVSASSENSNFPASNLQHFFRSRVWRSNDNGNFVIDSSNQWVDFDEGGAELNAQLNTGTYTAATLATEIETRMDALAVADISVSFSTGTGQWTISTAGATLNLLWSSGTNTANTAGSTIGFTVSSDDTGATSYVSDDIAIHTEETITVDLQSALDVDSVAILFDGDTSSKLSSTATVRIQANSTDSWSSPAVNQLLTYDSDRNIFTHFFVSDQTYRYWRLQIIDTDNTNLYVEIPKLVLSDSNILTQNPEIGFQYGLEDTSKVQKNSFGNEFVDIYPRKRSFRFDYKVLSEADLETLFQVFERVGIREPVCVALDPLEAILEKDRFFIYGKFGKKITGKQRFSDFFDAGLTVMESF